MKRNYNRLWSMLCLLPLGSLAGCNSGSSGSSVPPPKNVAPAITSSPSSQTVTAGQTATFTASASGTPTPTVQWQVSSNQGAFANIGGATSAPLMLTGTTASQNGNQYQAVFTNSVGTATTTAATLTVDFAPQITQQPTNQSANAGGPASFTAAASGNPAPTVQWQVSSGGGAFTNISGATSTTLSLTTTTAAMNGNQYQAVFTNSVGSATTSAATLMVTAPAAVSGASFDGPVVGATIDAFAVSSIGVLSGAPIASAITNADGGYSLNLPAGFSGPLYLTSLGGTYKDDVTGQTVQATTLSVLLPSASDIPAEMTPLTSMAAQLALNLAAATGTSPASIANNLNMAINTYFGGAGNPANTPLVDVTSANCATTATRATTDISYLLAGLSQLAFDNGVSSAALTDALVLDFTSNGTFLGVSANGMPITVPLENGSGVINLCTIEGNCPGSNSQLAQTIAAAVTAFENSVANACGAMMSMATLANLNNPATTIAFPPPLPGTTPISVSGTITSLNPNQTAKLRVGTATTAVTGLCGNSGVNAKGGTREGCPGGVVSITGNGAFTNAVGASYSGFNVVDLSVTVSDSSNESCGITTPAQLDVTPNTPISISGIQISCSAITYPVSLYVPELAVGQTFQVQNFGTDTLTVSSSGFPAFSTQLTFGSAYDVTISTQPASETCSVKGTGMGTVPSAAVEVDCGTTGTGAPALLSNPNGLLLNSDQTLLYLANAGGNQVLVYNITRSAATGAVTALNLQATITTDIVNPTRLAFDATGEFLYVTNFGPALSTGWVSVYDTANSNAEVIADKIAGGSVSRPLGVSVDAVGNVYIAENARNAISVYQPISSGGFQEASFSPILTDAAGNQFPAPGALSFFSLPGGDFLFVGTNAGNVFLYPTPLTNTSTPLYTLSHGACSSASSGPTGFAMLVGGISTGPQSDSSFFVTDFHGGDVLGYTFNNFFTSDACPAVFTQTPAGSNSSPEGLVIDAYRNVFVTNAGANSLFVYTNGGLTTAPTLTEH